MRNDWSFKHNFYLLLSRLLNQSNIHTCIFIWSHIKHVEQFLSTTFKGYISRGLEIKMEVVHPSTILQLSLCLMRRFLYKFWFLFHPGHNSQTSFDFFSVFSPWDPIIGFEMGAKISKCHSSYKSQPTFLNFWIFFAMVLITRLQYGILKFLKIEF